MTCIEDHVYRRTKADWVQHVPFVPWDWIWQMNVLWDSQE